MDLFRSDSPIRTRTAARSRSGESGFNLFGANVTSRASQIVTRTDSVSDLVTAIHVQDGLKRSTVNVSTSQQASNPFSGQALETQKKEGLFSTLVSVAQFGAEHILPRPAGVLSLFFEPSKLGRSGMDYLQLLNATQRKMYYDEGYRLFINPAIAADLNAFGRAYSKSIMKGKDILKMAKEFDRLFTPGLDVFTFLVKSEFPVSESSEKQYDSRKQALYSISGVGGMKGGGWNAKTRQPTGNYWGITQFGAETYNYILSFAKSWGVDLPSLRTNMTYGQMLVAAYVLALIRQPELVVRKIPVIAATVYVNHNQGVVWGPVGTPSNKPKPIKALNWDGQSAQVKAMLSSYGFYRAG